MVREAGAEYVIIGHSERRALFGETDETVNLRTRAALAAGLVPIVCVGETLEQRDAGQTLAVVDQQLQRGLDGVDRRPGGGDGGGLRAGVGHRHRPQRHPRAGRRGPLRTSACGCGRGGGRRPRSSAT